MELRLHISSDTRTLTGHVCPLFLKQAWIFIKILHTSTSLREISCQWMMCCSSQVTQLTDEMFILGNYGSHLKMRRLCMQSPSVRDSWQLHRAVTHVFCQIRCRFSLFWCRRLCEEPFQDLAQNSSMRANKMREVVWGIPNVKILFAEIKAVFLWWKCMHRCCANFHPFHSRHRQRSLSGLCLWGTFLRLRETKMVRLKKHGS